MKSAIADLAEQRKAAPNAIKVGRKAFEEYPMSVADLRSLLTTGEHKCGDMTLTVDTEDPTVQRLAEEIGDEPEEAANEPEEETTEE